MGKIPKARAVEKLERAIKEVETLKTQAQPKSPEFSKWQRDTQVALGYIFGDNSHHAQQFGGLKYHPSMVRMGGGPAQFVSPYLRGLGEAKAILESMLQEVNEYWEDESAQEEAATELAVKPQSNRVFVVHGHDEAMRESVARFLSDLALKPIVLHEQPNQGRTIIEKFEDYSDVGFAVVLLSPDDVGASQSNPDAGKPRARQNVVLELGFFLGKLGRHRVCPLCKGDVEIPSDFHGVVYVPFDAAGAWKIHLLRELREAGFKIDANAAF